MNAKAILLVGVGGAIGTLLRYSLYQTLPLMSLWITVLCNISGAFLLSVLYSYIAHKVIIKDATTNKTDLLNEKIKLFFGVGLLGSFTTFSTISLDIYTIQIEAYHFMLYIPLYVCLTFIGGFLATVCGYLLVKRMLKKVK